MKTAKLGDVFEWMGQLVRVEWINPGEKSIGFRTKEKCKCPHCGGEVEYETGADIIEASPLFQKNAEPVTTIKS